jgi:hypothetical protein
MTVAEIQKIIEKKVLNRWVPEHNETGHHYKHVKTGKLVDSVSTKLIIEKEHLKRWAVNKALDYMKDFWPLLTEDNKESLYKSAYNAHIQIRDNAGDTGHTAHSAAEDYVIEWGKTGVKPVSIIPFVKDQNNYSAIAAARSLEDFFNKNKVEIIATELIVGDTACNSAGTLDAIALWNDEVVILDYKTSNQISDSFSLQVSAYAKMFTKMTKIPVSKVKILHLSKDYDKCTVYDLPDIESAYKAFKAISKVYDWVKDGKPKFVKDVKKLII